MFRCLALLLSAGLALADSTVPLLPSESEGTALLERWKQAQNQGDFAAYQALYADPFVGIRRSGTHRSSFDRAGWIRDRERMFKKKMTVTLEGTRLAKSAAGLVARFTQIWESGNYRDSGNKELLLVRAGDQIRIAREEQLSSRRLGAGGALTWVVWPAQTSEAADAAKAELERLTASLSMLQHFQPTAIAGVGIVLAACAEADLEPVLSSFSALQPRVESRPAPPGTAPSCPTLAVNPDTQTGWSWPQISSKRIGKRLLTLLALQRDEDEPGDFARNYKETMYLSVLRAADGSLSDVNSADSGSDYAWYTDVGESGGGFDMREEFVDEPCDGMSRHRQRHYQRTLRFTVQGDKLAQKDGGKRLLQTITCTDDEAQLYR